ncbi:MAG: APC family permease [Gemmatimonadetes bacterium]|nr:MAG: amino acid transporter [Gemmatimonadota bacterium]TLY49237.1 MAG: APC family permease [Gemmatimonadota bacterium]
MTARRSSALRLGPLVAVMFFTVSGGPFGLEGLVGSVGPGLALLLLVATPLLYSVPETLLIGELASMLPMEGGYYQWVKRAFGRFWGFWNGWLSWVYSLIDMAIYPVLCLQYVRFFAPGLGRLDGWLLALAMIWGATWLNLRGTRTVGTASGWFVAAVLAPFGVLALTALVRWLGQPATPFPVTPFHAAGTSFLGALGLGVSQSIWNYSGWDNASTIGGEIEQATATYPRALARALPLVTVVYLVSIVPVLALTPWTSWTDGAWPDLARAVVGPWLGRWVAVAGVVSAFALFNALLLAYSRIPLVLAQDGLLPAPLAATDARGTPRNAVLVSAVVYSVFALLPASCRADAPRRVLRAGRDLSAHAARGPPRPAVGRCRCARSPEPYDRAAGRAGLSVPGGCRPAGIRRSVWPPGSGGRTPTLKPTGSPSRRDFPPPCGPRKSRAT